MFNLCEHTAYSRNVERSKKVITFKVSPQEEEALKNMLEYYNQRYMSNLIRIALEDLHDKMKIKK